MNRRSFFQSLAALAVVPVLSRATPDRPVLPSEGTLWWNGDDGIYRFSGRDWERFA